ncbi:MAG TPA: M81 family metallopeptidase [Candidatus Bathyarchaeia archaeon]|nr:M81 family metallopeptidase [Candidatus Bathyarchaeia archaeon]
MPRKRHPPRKGQRTPPRLAIGGIHIESSTFSPHRSGPEDFTVVRGDELLGRYADLPAAVDWLPLVHARALPGGAVERGFYESIKTELLDRLRAAMPLDGVFLDIHGAMSVVGMTDAEADLARAVRNLIGAGPLLSAAMDPHGNMSRSLIDALDLATSHRMSPHEDAPLTKTRAMANLVGCVRDGVRPLKAWVGMPVLLPGERACTRDEPARGIYGRLAAIETKPGIVDAAVWIGYAWADEPRCRAAVVVTGTDRVAILREARALAESYWDARADFSFSVPAGDADWCIGTGLAASARPYFISDSGDNPTAGGAGDVALMLERLLANRDLASGRATAIWASLVDPDAVARCVAAGEGRGVQLAVGGAFGSPHGTVPLRGTVARVVRDDPIGGDIAVVASGGIRAILTTRRKPYHYVHDLLALGLDPARHDLTVVKIGYLVPDLFAAAKGWVLALTPGGVDQDIVRLGHRHLERPIYPFDPNMAAPDLEPELLEATTVTTFG